MKHEFSHAIEQLGKKDKKIVFLTGDLGFNAFENLMLSLTNRFINAGIAEQNMISVAAGMAYMGMKPWTYSIAPFVTLKTIEQTRNDVCHVDLPVKLVGIGGGYGYGIMGGTHHVLEDIAIFTSLPNMTIHIPAFLEDINIIVQEMYKNLHPSYLRLGIAPKTNIRLPEYSGIRQIKKGNKITMAVLGPLIHNSLKAIEHLGKRAVVDLWSISKMPLDNPQALFNSIKHTKKLIVIEEHTKSGGVGEKLLSLLSQKNILLHSFIHLYACGYPSGLYGSQLFHHAENNLHTEGILTNIYKLING